MQDRAAQKGHEAVAAIHIEKNFFLNISDTPTILTFLLKAQFWHTQMCE